MKTVDIIIPSYKPDKEFVEMLQKLQQQNYPIANIIIINTEEKYWNQLVYGRRDRLNDYKNLKVYHHSKREFDHGRTRDRAAKYSKADILLFMTQDAIPADKEVVACLVKALEEEEVAIAYARQLPSNESSEIEKVARAFNYPGIPMIKSKDDLERLGIKTYFCSNVCAAYKREIYEKLGGFTKKTIFNEDMIFAAGAIKAGYKIAYVPEAKVIHSHNYTNKQQFGRNFDLGVSQADHPEVFAGVPSEKEGIKLVKATQKHLVSIGKRRMILPMYLTCAFKLLGYQLGKNYKKLPMKLVVKYSMNREYWEK